MDSVPDAVRQAFRRLAHRPGLTAAVVVILALGIGVSTAVFSVVERVLLRPLPVPELDRLVVAWETDPSQAGSLIEVSLPYFLDWRAQNRSFDDLAAFGSVNWSLELKGPPGRETVSSAAVSPSFFDTLRARPALGRVFLPEEAEAADGRVIVLSHALWQRRFAGDPAVAGTKVASGADVYTIVGVMPRDFDFPHGAQVWTPVGPQLEQARRSMSPASFRGLGVLYVLGRLKTGVSLETARADLADISRRLSLADGNPHAWSAQVVPLVDHHLGVSTRRALEALAAASGFVLLLAWANVAVLLLVQAIARRADLAVRQALGASAVRIASHQLAETGLLAFTGGLAGVLLARWIVQAVAAFGPTEIPGLQEVRVDGGALGFALLVTIGAAVLVALGPLWLATRVGVASALKAGGRGGGSDRLGFRLSRLLVTSEVALSIALLVGCGLMVRSLGKLLRVELGFVADHALSFAVDADDENLSKAQRLAFHRALLERLRALPGVEAAGATHLRPLEHGPIGSDNWVLFEGQSLALSDVRANSVSVTWQSATPGYLRAVGTRLIEGRDFGAHDTEDAPKVAIVSAGLARRCWPGESALGKRIHTADAKAELKGGRLVDVEWQTVVGVVEDARYRGIQNPRLDVYLPETQTAEGASHFVVRTTHDPVALVAAVRSQVSALDPDATVANITTLTRLVDRALAPWRFTSALLLGFAGAALVLTASGLFAVLHHFVSGRTREIAIRMALGADPRRVLAFVLRQGLGVTSLGAALGLTLSLVLARSLSALLYGVGTGDPWSYLGGVAVIACVGTSAALLPALRAARVQPTVALRSE